MEIAPLENSPGPNSSPTLCEIISASSSSTLNLFLLFLPSALGYDPDLCPLLEHTRLLAFDISFSMIEPAAHMFIERRPYIHISIAVF